MVSRPACRGLYPLLPFCSSWFPLPGRQDSCSIGTCSSHSRNSPHGQGREGAQPRAPQGSLRRLESWEHQQDSTVPLPLPARQHNHLQLPCPGLGTAMPGERAARRFAMAFAEAAPSPGRAGSHSRAEHRAVPGGSVNPPAEQDLRVWCCSPPAGAAGCSGDLPDTQSVVQLLW